MTKKELCGMCTEYSSDIKCDKKKDCELQKILSENGELRKELRELRKELRILKKEYENLQFKRSWEIHPDMMGR